MRAFVVVTLSAALAAGCAGRLDVSRVVSPPDAAMYRATKLRPTSVLRGEGKADLPEGALVDAKEVRVPQPGPFVYHLDPGETVEKNPKGEILAVHTPGEPPGVTRFIAGTATQQGDDITGELEGHELHVPLLPTDRVMLAGTLEPGDTLPAGGKVESVRAWSALLFGGVAFMLAYVPSIYVAASSSTKSEGWLAVPVIGPWAALGAREACVPDPNSPGPTCAGDATSKIGLITDGIIQAVSTGILLVGLPSHTEVTWPGGQARMRVVPTFGTANGLAVVGTF
ncbi:MAG TPA: hypothetical protein VF316_03925 [Polyangiaceae bacterium]